MRHKIFRRFYRGLLRLLMLVCVFGIAWSITGSTTPLPQKAETEPGRAAEVLSVGTPPEPAPALSTDPTPPILQSIPAYGIVSRELVSTTQVVAGGATGNLLGMGAAMSVDGRFVAFTTEAALVTEDTNDSADVYLLDRESDALRWVSKPAGDAGENRPRAPAGSPSISADGRIVAFVSWAGDLVPDDTNAARDVFVYDAAEDSLRRVSVSSEGRQGNDYSGDGEMRPPGLSADGRFVAFHSPANNLVAGDANRRSDVFVFDLLEGETQRVSISSLWIEGDDDSTDPALSADGRYVAFQSQATNLAAVRPVMAGGRRVRQIYLHDRTTRQTTLISRAADGQAGNGDSDSAAISGDGRYVAFRSAASNLVEKDTNGATDIFVYDRLLGKMQRVSVSSAGMEANAASSAPAISLNGQHVAFLSAASNLVSGDTNGVEDHFAHHLAARHTSRVSVGVSGPWLGIQGNGPALGTPALSADGRLIVFLSTASNLIGDSTEETARESRARSPAIFVHQRVDPPIYAVSGRAQDAAADPIVGVELSAGPHRTTSGVNGEYRFDALVGGTYTLVAAKEGYHFSPQRRIVSLLNDTRGQNFTGFADADGVEGFLELPIATDEGLAAFARILLDTDEGGLIDAWFDHSSPDYAKDGAMVTWDGRRRTASPYNRALGCFERRCYDGHDGIDFPYLDPNPATPDIYEPMTIRPAASGRVIAVHTACAAGDRSCNGGYGNEAILDHGNGYFTRYSHLARVDVQPGAADAPTMVTPADSVGVMGSTGNSYGVHLHFSVHLDDGNGRWDGEKIDLPVDPFGWAGSDADPWAANAVSRRLWRFQPGTELYLFGSQGGVLKDASGTIIAAIPAGSFSGEARIELAPAVDSQSDTAPIEPPFRSVGSAFTLHLLEWFAEGGATASAIDDESVVLAQPVEITVRLNGIQASHLDLSRLLLYRTDSAGRQPLPTRIERETGVGETGESDTLSIRAASPGLGRFDLLAPLLCPGEIAEPDDAYFAAVYVEPTISTMERLLDVADDEDWFRFDAVAGRTIHLRVEAKAGVLPELALFDVDGLTRLAVATAAGATSESDQSTLELVWDVEQDGTYFGRVAALAGSAVGCEAAYTVSVQ